MTKHTLLGVALVSLILLVGTSGGATIGYWRMESDTDGGGGYSVPEESAGNPLIGAAGFVNNVTLPADPVPLTGAANTRSLEGGANINGSIASFAALNTESITVEFWAQNSTVMLSVFSAAKLAILPLMFAPPSSDLVFAAPVSGTGSAGKVTLLTKPAAPISGLPADSSGTLYPPPPSVSDSIRQ